LANGAIVKKITILISALLAFGCVNEVTRNLLDQTEKAGKIVKEKSTQPEIAQAGADIEANMKVAKGAVGEPRNPALEYSQAECARLRQRQIELIERANWWKDLATNGIVGLLSLFGVAAPPLVLKLLSWRKKAKSIYDGLENAWEKIPVPIAEKIKNELRASAEKFGTDKSIKRDIAPLIAKRKS